MRIASSEILYSSQHTLVEEHTRREELVAGVSESGVWDQGALQDGTARTREREIDVFQPSDSEPTLLDEYLGGRSLDSLRTQIATRLTDEAGRVTLPAPIEAMAPLDAEINPENQLKMQLIQAAVEAFSGRPLRIFAPADLDLGRGPEGAAEMAPPIAEAHHTPEDGDEGPTFGLLYHYQETHYERETTIFHAEGVVRTADGEEIDVDVSLTMERRFASEESLEVRIGGALQDPLVVNFEGPAADLTERTYHFDLDTDGQAEQIHFVGPSSGFLALDRDGSGTIDDGSELFGARTGNGFAELAAYDEDGNRFIDEADSVYEGLRIWQKDGAGNDRLLALGQSGVGAIYLGYHDTPFQVKGEANQLQGVVRSSGIYLMEGGGTGTVQQLDLVV